jgi:hypothetical protein
VINPDDIRTTDFSFINDSGMAIVSQLMVCHINEAFGSGGEWGQDDAVRMTQPRLINPGGDASVTQCLKSMGGFASNRPFVLNCADVVVSMNYYVKGFPAEYRVLLTRYKDQYQWTREGLSTPTGLCGGAPLPKRVKPQLVPCTQGVPSE